MLTVVVCVVAAVSISSATAGRQKTWLEAIEARVSATSNMLGSMKGVKTTGLTDRLYDIISKMKEDEIMKSRRFRMLLLITAAIGTVQVPHLPIAALMKTIAYSNGAVAPVASLAVYSIIAKGRDQLPLTNVTAVTALTLCALLAVPIMHLIEAANGLASATGSMARIDKFLRGKSFPDGRLKGSEQNLKTPRLGTEKGRLLSQPDQSFARTSAYQPVGQKSDVVVSRNRTAGWGKEGTTVLRGLNFDIQPAALTVIIGPIGSGKSTILNAILGEIPDYEGYMWTSAQQLAYCGQNPWLTNRTLRDNILGETMLDVPWYNTVIRACALDTDLKILPKGDQTMLGSGGGTLSGGQKQRVVCLQ